MSILDSAKKAYTKGKKARSSASSRGVVTSQRPQQKKKKKKERRAEEPRQQTQRSAPKPKVQNRPSAKTQPLQKVNKQSVQSQYNSYKRSAYKPTVTNTSNTSLSSAQKAFQKGQDIRANQQKKGVVGTQANKPKSNVISDFTKPKNYDAKKDLQKAYQKGSQTTYLGTKQKKTTTNVTSKLEQKAQAFKARTEYYKSDDWTNTKTELKKQNRRMWIDGLRENGWTDDEIKAWWNTEKGKKARTETYVEAKNSVKKDINKTISDDISKTNTLNSVNALTKGEMNRVIAATPYGKEKGTNLLKGGKRLGQKDISRKVGNKTAETAYKGKFASGVIQGLSPVDTFSSSVGTYSKGASTAIQKTKESKAYLGGYGVGFGVGMLGGGVASRGTSIAGAIGKGAIKAGAKGSAKAGAKAGTKAAAKNLPKNVVQDAVKEYAKISGKDSAKKFAKNRVGELVAETPSNVLDAAKMSMDEKGNLDKGEFKKWLAINSGMTVGMGGAFEGIGRATTKKTAEKTLDLLGKQQAGKITAKESEKLGKNIDKLKNKASGEAISGDVAHNALADIKQSSKTARQNARLAKAQARSASVQSAKAVADETQELLAKQQAGTITKTEAKKLGNNIKALKNASKGGGIVADTAKKAVSDVKQVSKSARMKNKTAKSSAIAANNAVTNAKRELEGAVKKADNVAKASEEAKALQKQGKKVPDYDTIVKKKEDAKKRLEELKDLKEKPEGQGVTTLDHSISELEATIKDLEHQESIAWNAARQNPSRLKALAEEAQTAKARVDQLKQVVKDLEEKAAKANTPEAKAQLEVAKEAEAKAESNLAEAEAKAADVPFEGIEAAGKEAETTASDVAETVEAEAKSTPSNPSAETKKLEKAKNKAKEKLDAIEETLEKYDKEGGKLWKQKTAAKDNGTPDEFLEQRYKDNQQAQAELRKERDELKADYDKKQKAYEDSMSYAHVDDEIPGLEKTGNKQIDDVVAESNADFSEAPIKKPSKMGPDNVVDAETNVRRFAPYRKFREAIVDNFDSLEHIANHLPQKQRDAMLAQINELRRAQKTGRALVATKGRNIYADFGLTKRGAKAAQKRADFEEYCFLQHELDRKKQGNNFTNKSAHEINTRLLELERQYATKIDKETGEILETEFRNSKGTGFQQRMVKYFDDLLKLEEAAGITSKEEAANFRKMYPNYVPTYKPSEFDQMLKRRTSAEIDVGRGIKAATGGEHDLVPLYNQMQVKTNVVVKRTELNRTLNLLCSASGTTKEELENALPYFKHMPDEEKPQALLDTQVFTKEKDGKHLAVMYHNGEEVKISIDKDVYDAIRRWSGEDRKFVTLATLVDNTASRAVAAQFKKWITDYSLIFGLKNFKRDTATALFYTKNLKGYVKNFPKSLALNFLPEKLLSKDLQMYKKAMKVYEENGGVISQFVARDSATPNFFDPINKANPLKWVENFNSRLETVPRTAEFLSALDEKAIKAAGKDGNYEEAFENLLKDKDAIADAMYRAKDVTLNFDRSGYLGAAINRGMVPFFNPAIQGLDKLGRKLIRDNIKYGENGKLLLGKGGNAELSFFKDTTVGSMMKLGAALGGMVALPTVAWNEIPVSDGHTIEDYINGEVEGYEKQSDYNRYTNYLLPVGDGKFIKIPKARELASMQAVIDWSMDNMKYGSGSKWERLFSMESVRDWKRMATISREQIGPVSPITDNLISPIWRTYRNETWYGGKIESGNDLTLRENGERYKIWDEKTSAFAKMVGKQFNISPKKVDNVLDSYTGIIFDLGVAQFSAKNDLAGRIKSEGWGSGVKTMLSTPFSQGFVIDSVFQNANKTDYYDYVDKRNKKLEGLKEGSDEYVALKAEINKDKNAFAYTSTQYDELISRIYLDENLTPTQKNFYARKLKQGDNVVWGDRKDGRVTVSRDPMADAWNMKNKKGQRVMSTKDIINSCSYTFKNGSNNIKDAYKAYHKNGGKSDEKFMEVTLSARDVNRAAGDSLSSPRWEVVAYSNQLNHIKNSDKVLASYIEDDKKRNHLCENARIFEEHGFNIRHYKAVRNTITQGAYDLGYDYVRDMRDGELTMLLSNKRTKKGTKYRDGMYQANDYYILNRMNSARCLDAKKNGHHTAKEVKAFCDKYKLDHDDNYKWDEEKVQKAIEKEYKGSSQEVKAAMFQVITGYTYKNPFGSVGDYSLDTDTGIYCEGGWTGYGRRRRHGRRRYGHGGGGGGGKSSFTPIVNTAGKNAKITDTSKSSKSSKSNLDDAYRRKVKKLREATRKN